MTVTGVLFVIGLWLAIWFVLSSSIIHQIQLVRRTHTTWISALPSTGRVEVTGAVMGESITSPLGDKPCLVWQVEVLKMRKSNNRTSWKRIYERTSTNSIRVDDGTGKILIHPENAEIILSEGDLINESQATLLEKLKKLGFDDRDALSEPNSLQVYERRVTEGDEIYITGTIQHLNSDISLKGKPSDPLVIRTESERKTLGKLYEQVVMKGVMTFFITLGAVIIYFGLLRS